MRIILASNSPRRKDLLNQIGIKFEIMPSDIDEDLSVLEGTINDKLEQLAFMKAKHIAEKIDEGLVIGADTVVVIDDIILGKPVNEEDAYKMLKLLNGRTHQVITGISVIDAKNNEYKTDHVATLVEFNDMSDQEIWSYIKSKEPMGKAGAYGIQGLGALLVKHVSGDYFNIVGLPLNTLNNMLLEFGYRIL